MKNLNINRLMNILIGVSSALIVIGSLFRIQHYPYGDSILTFGFLSYIVFTAFEIQRLKQIIKDIVKK